MPRRRTSPIDINQPGANTSFNGAAGLYIKGHFGEHAFGFNISDVPTGGGYVSNPVTVQLECDFRLNHRSDGSSSAGSPASRVLLCLRLCGQDVLHRVHRQNHARRGVQRNQNLQGGQDIKLSDNFGKATISTTYGIDVGAIYRPSSWLRFGVVAKDINQPEFDAPDGTNIKLGPQVRGGMALNPYSSLTLSADVDITSNKTLVPGLKSQVLSLGAEQTILTEFLSFRVGAFKNMQDAGTPFTPTAGLGVRIFAFRLDVGGGYDFREKGALASGSVSLTF